MWSALFVLLIDCHYAAHSFDMTGGSRMLLRIQIGWGSIGFGLTFAEGFCLFILGRGSGWLRLTLEVKSLEDHSSGVAFTSCAFLACLRNCD
jgi:hypothetical protein